jgi:glutamate---cysteine ligase / carboxylate-amine ligase
VEQNFGKSAPFSLGVEEEFQILNSESYELVSRIDEILPALEGDREEKRIKAELLQSVVEVATDVAATVGEAMEDLRRLGRGTCEGVVESGAPPCARSRPSRARSSPRREPIRSRATSTKR